MATPFDDLSAEQRIAILDILLFVMHSDGAEASEALYISNFQNLGQLSPEVISNRSQKVKRFFDDNHQFLESEEISNQQEFIDLFISPLMELGKAKVWSLFSILFRLIWADGYVSETEWALFELIGKSFGLDSSELASILDEHSPQ